MKLSMYSMTTNQIKSSRMDKEAPFGEMKIVEKDLAINFLVSTNKEGYSLEDIRHLGGEARKYIGKEFPRDAITVHIQPFFEEIAAVACPDFLPVFMEGWYLASYTFSKYKHKEMPHEPVLVYDQSLYGSIVEAAKTKSEAVNIARELCNEPANKLTPAIYAEKLLDIFRNTDVHVDILAGDELDKHGLEAIKTVGQGSINPPRMAVLTLKNSESKHVALVGKGVTFDSGGVNVKTGKGIWEMKMDMGGSAAVVGAMKLLSDLKRPVHVTAVIPLVENLAGTNAYLPADIIRYANGLHVEVGNTDAEGRLVLADGMLYAQSIGAETVIDIATLTGAIGQALGLKAAGIFSNREADLWMYKQLGDQTGDYVWPMPVFAEYQEYMKSDYADLNNMSSSDFGGAITAAIFLSNFVGKNTKWVHIDMANTVRPWKQHGYHVAGASGFGVRLLTEMVCKEGEVK